MKRSSDIRGFFRPTAQSQTLANSHSSLPKPPQSPQPASSPKGPKTPETMPDLFSRDRIIKGSDEEDEDGDSDSSLEDLSAVLFRGKATSGASVPGKKATTNPWETPRAKRTAVEEFHSSPLAIMSKHKFDMKALVKDAKRDDATVESSKRAVSLEAAEEDKPTLGAADRGEAMRQSLMSLVNAGDEEADVRKIMRAVERTEAVSSRPRWYFFNMDSESRNTQRRPFPESAAKGTWQYLADPLKREGHVMSGLPYAMLKAKGELPDELFLWFFDQSILAESAHLREAYANLFERCPEQIHRLVDGPFLLGMLEKIGASEEVLAMGPEVERRLRTVTEITGAYEGRDWSRLRRLLETLANVANSMDVRAITGAANVLLLMAVDKVVMDNVDILAAYVDAMASLLEAIPQTQWDKFVSPFFPNLGGTSRAHIEPV
jgi:hypothetical protein